MNGVLNTISAAAIVLALLSVIVGRYQGYVADRDFLLRATTSCDPGANACFVSGCRLVDGGDCEPYAKVEVLARDAPACLEEHTCATFSCKGRPECQLSYCSDTALEDGEQCMGEGVPGAD